MILLKNYTKIILGSLLLFAGGCNFLDKIARIEAISDLNEQHQAIQGILRSSLVAEDTKSVELLNFINKEKNSDLWKNFLDEKDNGLITLGNSVSKNEITIHAGPYHVQDKKGGSWDALVLEFFESGHGNKCVLTYRKTQGDSHETSTHLNYLGNCSTFNAQLMNSFPNLNKFQNLTSEGKHLLSNIQNKVWKRDLLVPNYASLQDAVKLVFVNDFQSLEFRLYHHLKSLDASILDLNEETGTPYITLKSLSERKLSDGSYEFLIQYPDKAHIHSLFPQPDVLDESGHIIAQSYFIQGHLPYMVLFDDSLALIRDANNFRSHPRFIHRSKLGIEADIAKDDFIYSNSYKLESEEFILRVNPTDLGKVSLVYKKYPNKFSDPDAHSSMSRHLDGNSIEVTYFQ